VLLPSSVIAVEGETIEIRDKVVYIDGQEIEDPWGLRMESMIIPGYLSQRDTIPPLRIPAKSVFVLGDNRDRSLDSRFFGPVKVEDIRAKALYIYWAKDWNRIGMSVK
jgi:signal peptidase I